MLRVAVDFGTSSTCTAVSVDGRAPQVVAVDGAPLMPSAVYVTADGTVFVGHEAERQAAIDPSRYEPHPKRRIDESELLLGDTVLPLVGVIRAVLRRALHEAGRLAGGAPVDQLVLTHPADWGAARSLKLRRCAHGLAADVVLIAEPVAAAVFHANGPAPFDGPGTAVPDGGCLAVLDLGGGTVDASVVQRGRGGFRVLAARGDPSFGGADIDQALLEHIGAQVAGDHPEAWQRLVDGRELAERRRRRVLRLDVRGAKETLSRHAYADVPMPPPFPDAHVTRDDLEGLIAAPLGRTVTLLEQTITAAGLSPQQLAGVFLVGGSSRIPMVSRLLYERLRVLPVTLDQPETVAVRGAMYAVMAPRLAATVPPGAAAPPAGPGQPGQPAQPGQPGRPGRPAQPQQPQQPQQPRQPRQPGPAGLGPAAVGPPGPGGFTRPGPAAPDLLTRAWPARRLMQGRTRWIVVTALLAAAAVAVALTVALTRGTAGEQVAEFHYRFTVPAGWERSGGDPARRQVEVAPADASSGPDRIFVTESELGYSAEADRDRAVGELRAEYDASRAASGPRAFDGFDPDATFAGRDVLYYSELVRAGTVDWYVLFGGSFQVSVGCQHGDGGAERVRQACERVVSTLSVGS